MENDLFLQHLRDFPLEEGKTYIQEHIAELTDHTAIGLLIADEALHLLYTPFISLKLAELLIFFGEYLHYAPSHALGLKAKGNALMLIGHYQAAITCLDTARDVFLQLGDEENATRSRISWIICAAWLGRVEEALAEAARSHDVFLRRGEHDWVCAIDHNTAMIYYHIGRYTNAIQLYQRIQLTYRSSADQGESSIKRSIAMAETNQARNLASLGNFAEAYRLQQQAQVSFLSLNETSCVLSTEVNLADLDYTQGYYGSALRRYYRALDNLMQNELDNPMLLAVLKLCIANCLVKINRAQEACLLAHDAVEIYRQSGLSSSIGIALHEYATTLIASGRLKDALAVLDEAWTLLNRGKFDPYASAVKLQQAEIFLEMGSFAKAYDQASLVKSYADRQGIVARTVHASLVMAAALIQNAQSHFQGISLQEALALCRQTALQARQHNLQEAVYKSHYLLGQVFALQGNPTKATRHYAAAIAQIERILDDLVYDLSPSFLHTTWAVYEDMIASCLQQSQAERAFSYLEQARSMALRQYLNRSKFLQSARGEQADTVPPSLSQTNRAIILRTQYQLREEQEQHRYYSILLAEIDVSVSLAVDRAVIQQQQQHCEEKISELSERLFLYQSDSHARPLASRSRRGGNSSQATRSTQRIDIAQLRQQLAPGQLLLTYFLYQGRLVIFAVTAERLITHENPAGAAQLELLLPLLHAHLDPRGWPNIQKPPQVPIRRLLSKLYDLLIGPVSALLPEAPEYLTIVPYGPLHKLPFHALYDGTHFLIEDFQINYLPTSSLLTHLGTYRGEQKGRATEIPTKPALVFGYSGNGHLESVLDEARAVAALLDGHCYLEDEATIARLIEQAPGSPIIHLATHGQSRLDAPNFSFVRLADGQLNAIDAFNLDLQRCELVTLSGCETGLALSGGGDEQLGLGRAFLAAGANSLVMSLWPVEDNATNELMQLFYQHLLQGDTRVQALRAAQCSLLHRTESSYTHPYFWAAFRLVGEVGALKFARAKERSFALAMQPLKK